MSDCRHRSLSEWVKTHISYAIVAAVSGALCFVIGYFMDKEHYKQATTVQLNIPVEASGVIVSVQPKEGTNITRIKTSKKKGG